MTRSDIEKVPFTLRMKKELSEKLEKEAEDLGISKSAYINMILHKAIKKNIS